MHIILGLLGTIVTILWLLHRLAEMGIDLGGLNPFLWRRRRAWRKRYEGNPINAIDDPVEVAALMVVGVAKIDGDLSAEEKNAVIAEFQSSFSMSSQAAAELLGASAHLLGAPQLVESQLEHLLEKQDKQFSPDQCDSVLAMMDRIAALNGGATAAQTTLMNAARSRLAAPTLPQGTWG